MNSQKIDLNDLKKQVLELKDKLRLMCLNSKHDRQLYELFSAENNLMLELKLWLTTANNTFKNMNRSKGINDVRYLASSCQMKQKKLKEKHEVISKLFENNITSLYSNTSNKELEDTKPIKIAKLSIDYAISKKESIENQNYLSYELNQPKNENSVCSSIPALICYICRKSYDKIHFFYDRLCYDCSVFNFDKRNQKCDLKEKIAVVTGCRIKIGYEICLFLLRSNCRVIGTTRFCKDAFLRFSKEPDFEHFKNNLVIFPLDLRDLKSVQSFIKYLYKTLPKLDILINNAAQTLRRNIQYYKTLINDEMKPLESFPNKDILNIIPVEQENLWTTQKSINFIDDDLREVVHNHNSNLAVSVVQSQIPFLSDDFRPDFTEKFPTNVLDKDNQQVDLTSKSSWNFELNEINLFEFVETQIINSWSPFMLCSGLYDLMKRNQCEPKFIINVSSMEGNFSRMFKPTKHSHTNMSKASLNMMTLTSGPHYAKSNIYMNSVDTGWVTEMNPSNLYSFERTVPLDEIDGAMRVLDPIIQGFNKKNFTHSKFLKNYKINNW